jgi:hypothetical protein
VDGDTHGDSACGGDDCNDADALVWGAPAGVTNCMVLTNSPSNISWDGQAVLAGPGTLYDLVSGEVPSAGVVVFSPAACLQNSTATSYSDARPNPPVNTAHWYLVRARNSCGTGSYGSSLEDSGIPPCP